MAEEDEQVERILAWFATKGFGLRVESRDSSGVLPRGASSSSRTHWVDLISLKTGEVFVSAYGSGPNEVLAIAATEQRWLVEQEGSGSSPGHTYVEMAEERLRRGRETN